MPQYTPDQRAAAWGGFGQAEQVAQALAALSAASNGSVPQQRRQRPTPLSQMPFEQAQQQVFSDPQFADTLRSIGGVPQRGQAEMMGGYSGPPIDMWNDGRPVADGAPYDPLPGKTYAERYKIASQGLAESRAKRGRISEEEKARIAAVVKANRERRREEMDVRSERASKRLPRAWQRAILANQIRPRGQMGRGDIDMLKLMVGAREGDLNRRESGLDRQQELQLGMAELGNRSDQAAALQQRQLAELGLTRDQLGLDRERLQSTESLAEARMRQQAQLQESDNQSRVMSTALRSDTPAAADWLAQNRTPEQQTDFEETQAVAKQVGILKSLRGQNPDIAIKQAYQMLKDSGEYTKEELEALLDEAGLGGTDRDPDGFTATNFFNPSLDPAKFGFVGARSPKGFRLLEHPIKYAKEFMNRPRRFD